MAQQLRRPGIPAVDPNLPLSLQQILQPLKENAEIAHGLRSKGTQVGQGVGYEGWSRRSTTLGMLVKLGIITEEQAKSVWQDP